MAENPVTPATNTSSKLHPGLGLLNEKLTVRSYDGVSFSNRPQYDIKNVLIPTIEPFHCSGKGVGFTLVLEAPEIFTMTHMLVQYGSYQ